MELVLITTAAAAAVVGAFAHANPARATGPLDTYTSWLLRQQKPSLHR